MTPARRAKLIAAIDLIDAVTRADQWAERAQATRNALIGIGAAFIEGNTNTMRLAGVTASCTWDKGEHLLTRWAANARTAIDHNAEPELGNREGEG